LFKSFYYILDRNQHFSGFIFRFYYELTPAMTSHHTTIPPSLEMQDGVQFPVGRVHRLLKKDNYAQRVGAGAPGQ
jgi:hypothetical protein